MKVLNIHSREINQPRHKVVELIKSLATEEDKIWPNEKWPAMRFKNGKKVGARGGHGPVGYYISEYLPEEKIVFQFTKPVGLVGSHTLDISESHQQTILKHTINAELKGMMKILWPLSIRPLHDALIEDAFDKVELNFSDRIEKNKWSLWVKFLRLILK